MTLVLALWAGFFWPVKKYAHARKSWHAGVIVGIFFVEILAITLSHSTHLHYSLAGSIAAWEAAALVAE